MNANENIKSFSIRIERFNPMNSVDEQYKQMLSASAEEIMKWPDVKLEDIYDSRYDPDQGIISFIKHHAADTGCHHEPWDYEDMVFGTPRLYYSESNFWFKALNPGTGVATKIAVIRKCEHIGPASFVECEPYVDMLFVIDIQVLEDWNTQQEYLEEYDYEFGYNNF